ncbi:hypothetical protein ANN_23285 [Periplaneta americana]|uniref:Uncharacterized protein n=1 Tax=Periplaneta americana TaxID=6978 RepID=A0ABQ8SLY2_PERAM|nr:hypothetical protein ANN_23285 [Periplaneta americana]
MKEHEKEWRKDARKKMGIRGNGKEGKRNEIYNYEEVEESEKKKKKKSNLKDEEKEEERYSRSSSVDRLAGLLILSCVRAWVGSLFGLIEWFLPMFSPAVGLMPDGLWRVLGLTLFHLFVLRRDEDSLLRKAFDYSPRCKRPLGRPRLRWQDQVYDNLSTVGGRQDDAENRAEWRYIVNEAKNHLVSEWDEGDNAGEMSPGSNTENYPAFAHIGLRENPGKNLNQTSASLPKQKEYSVDVRQAVLNALKKQSSVDKYFVILQQLKIVWSRRQKRRCQGQEYVNSSACDQALTGCNESILQAAADNKKG